MSRPRLEQLHPWLWTRVQTMQALYPARAATLRLGEPALELASTTRTQEAQAAAFAAGNSRIDGVTRWSLHQYAPALACDVCPVFGLEWLWTDGHPAAAARWDLVGILAKEVGLTWGGDWASFRDRPHVEVPAKQRIILLQEGIAARDLDPGPIDGILGPLTMSALRSVETAAGLAITNRESWWSIRPASWAAVFAPRKADVQPAQ